MSSSLGELIAALEASPGNAYSPIGIRRPHSWRGVYAELAFEPGPPMTVGEMVAVAKAALGVTYEGYKGGSYEMDEWTPVHLSFEGSSTDYFPLVALVPPEIVLATMRADYPHDFEQAGLTKG